LSGLVFISAYTAQLTADLSRVRFSFPVAKIQDIEHAQQEGKMGLVCVKASTAYANWLALAFPTMKFKHVVGGTTEMVAAMNNGECSGAIDVWINIMSSTNKLETCGMRLLPIGAPLRMGPQDFGVGVRYDLREVQAALSFWIQELRACNPKVPGSACYNGLNMDNLYERWYIEGECPSPQAPTGLEVDFFIFPLIFIWSVALLAILTELGLDRMRDRLGVLLNGSGIEACVAACHPACVSSDGVVDQERLRHAAASDFWARRHEWDRLATSLRRYYVKRDIASWYVLRAIRAQTLRLYEIYLAEKTIAQMGIARRPPLTEERIEPSHTLEAMASSPSPAPLPAPEEAASVVMSEGLAASTGAWRRRSVHRVVGRRQAGLARAHAEEPEPARASPAPAEEMDKGRGVLSRCKLRLDALVDEQVALLLRAVQERQDHQYEVLVRRFERRAGGHLQTARRKAADGADTLKDLGSLGAKGVRVGNVSGRRRLRSVGSSSIVRAISVRRARKRADTGMSGEESRPAVVTTGSWA